MSTAATTGHPHHATRVYPSRAQASARRSIDLRSIGGECGLACRTGHRSRTGRRRRGSSILLVDATDGRSHYVGIGRCDAVESLATGAIVRIEPRWVEERAVDRTVVEVAAANGGRYDVETHLRHDPSATQDFAEAHVRRLESLRRARAGVTRDPSGVWTISSDHLDRVAAHEVRALGERPVDVQILPATPLGQLIEADAATWLDREALAEEPIPLRDAGSARTSGLLSCSGGNR